MIPKTEKSQKLYERARKVLVEGVNSPSRGGEFYKPGPIFIDHGKGSKVYDADQNEYVDLMLGFSALVLGHAHPEIIAALELSLIHISEPTRRACRSRMPSSA